MATLTVPTEGISGDSNYTGTSIHEYNQSPAPHADPRLEKAKLKGKLDNQEEIFVGEIHSKAKLLERIAGGSFGEVYLGEMVHNKLKVAVKLEPQKTWIQPTLMNEGKVYRKMGSDVDRVPVLYWFGYYGPNDLYAAMIMDLLGTSLYQTWVECNQEFSQKTMLMIVDETLTCLENIHSRNCIHRDISPNNFAISSNINKPGDREKISIFDFGHAQVVSAQPQFTFGSRRPTLQVASTGKIAGTPRFASIFNHLGHPPSYRDDMESLGFVWIYLIKGRLPWQGLKVDLTDCRLSQIGKRKMETPLEVLCDRIPQEFVVYFEYVRRLGYLQRPDYEEIRKMFRRLGHSKGVEYDWLFDWNT
ncbi:hypothetical protein HELRODRAFT_85712 [Helobdella robusta]|uniref:Protein kinase domain-containing protein n=1 Tax=Helobdella robusta TaxID=6412 RepID=T1G621_HELRO|nr:hypothetical protein HELRODRAFT_85712 [Helobdella robusta]ESN97151.1 hypothetical protein HELRODRAFT_85712 [Helobdella robusta]